ncbi:MAG: hypothetical protein ACK6CT_03215 [Planctomycetia bacterium]
MTISELAAAVADACVADRVPHMVTGAIAAGLYGSPRSTADVDVVVDVADTTAMPRLVDRLSPILTFDAQIRFDTLTFGTRRVGATRDLPPLTVEFFALFDDPFVREQFSRRRTRALDATGRRVPVPSAEDVIIQKVRWGRGKDLDDARDVLAIQGLNVLDMGYIRDWCGRHGTSQRLEQILASIPPE